MKKTIRVLLALLLINIPTNNICALPENIQPLTLKEAIAVSLNKNRLIKISEHRLKSAKYELNSSYGNFLPSIYLEGKYTKLNSPIQLELDPLRSAMISADLLTLQASGATPIAVNALQNTLEASIPSFETQIQKNSTYNLTAGISQPIFTGGKLTANTKTKSTDYKIAQVEQIKSQNGVIANVVISYLKVQFMKEVVKIKEEVMEGIAEHKKNSERLFKEGIISKNIKMRNDVALSDAKREYFKATKDLELAEILLNTALGTENMIFNLTTELIEPGETKSLDEYIGLASENNTDILNLAHIKTLQQQKYKISLSNFMPTISAVGKYELYKDDLSPFEPEWSVGVVGSINIFNGASDLHKTKAALREIESAQENIEYLKEITKTEIIKFFHDMETAEEQLKSLKASLALAKENLKFNSNSFKEGLATSTDVIDAQIALSKVETETARALFDYDYALINLLCICGNASEISNFIK